MMFVCSNDSFVDCFALITTCKYSKFSCAYPVLSDLNQKLLGVSG